MAQMTKTHDKLFSEFKLTKASESCSFDSAFDSSLKITK